MGKKKILVVDFDQEFLRFLSQFLSNEGFSVSTAVDGYAGLEKCKDEKPDLIITEAMLPKLHGFELCSRVAHSTTQKIPVIIVTGIYKDTVYKTEALRTFGATAYFEKPIDPDDLLVSIRKVLNLPAKPGKSENDLDEAIMESLASVSVTEGSTGLQLQTGSRPASKIEKKDLGQDEIDDMLRTTLAEFGLKPGKKKIPVEAPKPKPSTHNPVPTVKFVPAVPKPVSDPGLPTPKAPTAPLPSLPGQRKSNVSTSTPVFGEFVKKKQPFSPRIFAAIAGIIILVGALAFLLKPGRSDSSGQEVSPPTTDGTALETSAPPAGGQQAPDLGGPAAKVKKQVKIPANTEARKRPEDKPVASPLQAAENAKPLVPDSNSQLQLQAPDSAGVDAAKETALDETAPAGDKLVSQVQDPSQEGSADLLAAPAVKLKAGDLVPLEDADIKPRVLKAPEPVYPPAALRMRVAGSVTVNALVSETGDVLQTTVVRGVSGALGFNKAAEAAVRRWKFSPAEKDGVKVRVWKPITVTFKLES